MVQTKAVLYGDKPSATKRWATVLLDRQHTANHSVVRRLVRESAAHGPRASTDVSKPAQRSSARNRERREQRLSKAESLLGSETQTTFLCGPRSKYDHPIQAELRG